MNKKLLALYSLKFTPFLPDTPLSALFVTPAIESFCWRMQNQVGEGGFAMVSGQPGTGNRATGDGNRGPGDGRRTLSV